MNRRRLLLASMLAAWVSMVLACAGEGPQSSVPQQEADAKTAQGKAAPEATAPGHLAEGKGDHPPLPDGLEKLQNELNKFQDKQKGTKDAAKPAAKPITYEVLEKEGFDNKNGKFILSILVALLCPWA